MYYECKIWFSIPYKNSGCKCCRKCHEVIHWQNVKHMYKLSEISQWRIHFFFFLPWNCFLKPNHIFWWTECRASIRKGWRRNRSGHVIARATKRGTWQDNSLNDYAQVCIESGCVYSAFHVRIVVAEVIILPTSRYMKTNVANYANKRLFILNWWLSGKAYHTGSPNSQRKFIIARIIFFRIQLTPTWR